MWIYECALPACLPRIRPSRLIEAFGQSPTLSCFVGVARGVGSGRAVRCSRYGACKALVAGIYSVHGCRISRLQAVTGSVRLGATGRTRGARSEEVCRCVPTLRVVGCEILGQSERVEALRNLGAGAGSCFLSRGGAARWTAWRVHMYVVVLLLMHDGGA